MESALADLDRLHIFYDPITPAAAYRAGQIFLRYRRDGGPRQHLIPDFLIAAHASVQADRLAAKADFRVLHSVSLCPKWK